MPEPKEQQGYELPFIVSIDHGRRFGFLLDKPGQSVSLDLMFGESLIPSQKVRQIYFRTDSGNIYSLTSAGLVNKKESQRQGRLVSYEIPYKDRKEMSNQYLTIGKPFIYGGSRKTTRVVEILQRIDSMYTIDYLKEAAKGRNSSIVEDFQRGMPPVP